MEIKLSQKLSQSLVMTPQLQQAIKLLQLSRLELIDEVRRELDANPVLADDDVDPRPRDNSDTSMPTSLGTNDQRPLEERFGETERVETERDLAARGEEKKAREVDWEQFLENRSMQQPVPASKGGFEELPPIEQSLTRPQNLQDHLRWQLQMADFNEEELEFAELVISSLDENGFLDLKSSYCESIAELEASVVKEPREKNLVFNLGVLHEKMGDLGEAREYLTRFLADDLTPEERERAEAAAVLVQRCQHGVEDVMKLLTMHDPQGNYREILQKLRGKEVSLADYRDGVVQLRLALADVASSRSGAKANATPTPTKDLAFFTQLEASLDELSSLTAPEGPKLRKQVFDRAIHDAHRGKFSDALGALARYLGKDLEPRERLRVVESISRLGPSKKQKSDDSAAGANLTVEHLADRAGLDPDDALVVLRMIQTMDPIGVASRDLRECLRVQAETYGFDELELSIIERHLHNLEKHNFQAIARDLKVPLEEVYEAAKEIQKLESRPARNYSDTDDKTIAITPDVYVVRDGDRWVVLDNDRGLQRLYINESLTKRLLKDPGAKDFLNEKLRSAHWLIRAIDQRRKTILRVTEAIVERQREFFERGVAFLKPMILRDIAEDVELHESTISRVTTNKYVHTPQGLFELKYFFNSSIRRVAEEDIASESVKQAIKKIIEEEDKSNPLSDQAIVELLEKREGIQIARRTVAKYREMLGILASSKRKKLF